MKAIIIDRIEGFKQAMNGYGMSLVWENRILLEAKAGTRHPLLFKYAMWHEWHHFLNYYRHGMTKRAFWGHFALDGPYLLTAGLSHIPMFLYWYFIVNWKK